MTYTHIYTHYEVTLPLPDGAECAPPPGGCHFGQTVAMSGSTLVVGAPYAKKSAGAVYIYYDASNENTTPSGTFCYTHTKMAHKWHAITQTHAHTHTRTRTH